MASNRRGASGRIHLHQRDTDDAAPLLGAGLSVPDGLAAQYNTTMKISTTDSCRKDYRSRIARTIKFWAVECTEYFQIGVIDVPPSDLSDDTKYYFQKHKKDLVYSGLNVKFVLHFLMSNKHKKDDPKKLKSIEDMRKYKDAIMWGAKVVGQRLPTVFYEEMDKFNAAYKKEIARAKKEGKVDETSADPIPFALYERILQWALESNNMLVWFWTVEQWNFMARSANIDPLGFHNFWVGSDSIIAKYDDSKADKSGERLSEKNIYANPENFQLCFFTAMGIWVSLEAARLAENERLFLGKNVEEGMASTKYCEQMAGLVKPHIAEIQSFMRASRFNPYGIRKDLRHMLARGLRQVQVFHLLHEEVNGALVQSLTPTGILGVLAISIWVVC